MYTQKGLNIFGRPIEWVLVSALWGVASDAQLAERLQCSETTVREYRKHNNLPAAQETRHTRALLKLNALGEDRAQSSYSQIAKKIGTSKATALRMMRRYYPDEKGGRE